MTTPERPGLRRAGILLHPTSLPGPFGAGDVGAGARAFVETLAAAGQRVWQMLPLHPPGPGGSPYQSLSAAALSALLLDPTELADLGLVDRARLEREHVPSGRRADHGAARRVRSRLLLAAFERLERGGSAEARALEDELAAFEQREAGWLDEWTLFAALKARHRGERWTRWEEGARLRRDPDALRGELTRERRFHAFAQLLLDRQWRALRTAARQRGIALVGDLPMFVSHDSADVWARRELFRLDADLLPTHVSGAPPDDFNAAGQVWGHPLFDWEAVRKAGFDWWIARVRRSLELFDEVRLDHFVGYRAAWEVPWGATSAAAGAYGDGPGAELFEVLERALGPLPFLAEDLGDVTAEVVRLRERLGFPGMRVLQFAFGGDGENPHLPHNHERKGFVYTGTHDNDTVRGWFEGLGEAERGRVLALVGGDGDEVSRGMVRLAWGSVAESAVAPVQDVLGLGSGARMNRPGTVGENWVFRVVEGELGGREWERLGELTGVSGRG